MMKIVSQALVLFFVMDPLGNIPVVISILDRLPAERRKRVLMRELVFALGFLIAFLLGGRLLLDLLHLEQTAIRVGGGVILFLIAIRLIFPREHGVFGDDSGGEPLVFPLAVPMIAGPSAFATVLLFAETAGSTRLTSLAAIGVAWLASAVILMSSPLLLRALGRRGLMAVERMMGMLLVMLAVQMVLQGIRGFLASPAL